jgi:hypothetical protein
LHFSNQPSVTATQKTGHKANKKTEEAEEEEQDGCETSYDSSS